MDYEELAKRIGTIPTGEPVKSSDVETELRSKSYISQAGKLSPSELFRLGVYAKRRAIQRIVDEAFANDAARAKRIVAPKRAIALARGTNPLFDPVIQARFKLEAWAGFRAGPVR